MPDASWMTEKAPPIIPMAIRAKRQAPLMMLRGQKLIQKASSMNGFLQLI
jgi:hypothetical protein